jgi:hypothetical protein
MLSELFKGTSGAEKKMVSPNLKELLFSTGVDKTLFQILTKKITHYIIYDEFLPTQILYPCYGGGFYH